MKDKIERNVEAGNEASNDLISTDVAQSPSRNLSTESGNWDRVQKWLQAAEEVTHYLVLRTIEKRTGSYPAKTSPLYLQTADADGELTEDLIVNYLGEMARLAADGFSTSSEFPVFAGI